MTHRIAQLARHFLFIASSYTYYSQLMSYAHGFKVPKPSDIKKALGELDDSISTSTFTTNFLNTFDALQLPQKSTDWLAQYAEKGQTFMEFVQLARTLNTPATLHRKTIYLTMFGTIDHSLLDIESLIDYTQRFFQMPVKIINFFSSVDWKDEGEQWKSTMTMVDGKTRNFNVRTRYHKESKHSQICVTSILNLLKKVVPLDARCLIALTMYDLYGNDTDLFIAGLAEGNCRVAAFSLYRYDPYLLFDDIDWFSCTISNETSSKIDSTQRQSLLLLRACRLLTHEIGHLFGIDHCTFYSCLMNGSSDLEEDFRQPFFECPIDLRKLQTVIKFDINKRYQDLLEFFQEHNCIEEIKRVENKLNALQPTILLDLTTCSTKVKRKKIDCQTSHSVSKRRQH